MALPLDAVREILRPLGLEPLRGAPASVRGLAVVRGEAVPVVDLGSLLTGVPTLMHRRSRWVRLELAGRRVVLAVDSVLEVRALDAASVAAAPPLLAELGDALALRIGTRDDALLYVLERSRIVPEAVLAELDAARAAASGTPT